MSGGPFHGSRELARYSSPGYRRRGWAPSGARSTPKAAIDRPCHWRCCQCGYIEGQRLGSSYRPAGEASLEPCPHCGATDWADLRDGAVVETLGDHLDALQSTRRASWRGIWTLVGTLVGLLAAVVTGLGRVHDGSVIVFPLVALILLMIIRGAVVDIQRGRRPKVPVRWRLALPPEEPERARIQGAVTAPELELLQAPLSGRPCVAYELGVRSDHDANADLWSWALLEQEVAPIEVDDEPIPADRVWLELDRTEREASLDDPAVRDLLRSRGIDPSRPGHVVFETIVERSTAVAVTEHEDGRLTLRPVKALG